MRRRERLQGKPEGGGSPPLSVQSNVLAVGAEAERPIFSRSVMLAIAMAVTVIALVTALILRSAPEDVVVGTIRSVGTHRLCVAAPTEKPRCVEADSPRSLEGFEPGDCVRVTSSSSRTLINLERVAVCP